MDHSTAFQLLAMLPPFAAANRILDGRRPNFAHVFVNSGYAMRDAAAPVSNKKSRTLPSEHLNLTVIARRVATIWLTA